MKNIKLKIVRIIVVISLIATTVPEVYSQSKDMSWEQLQKEYKFPEWYTKARFGIWVHWGAQTQPKMGGGWYARHMYMQDVGNQKWGKNAYSYHLKTYGHPSEKGYMEVLNDWKAEKLNTDFLVEYFKSVGAKYFVALANHHDHFDNWNSTHHPWNSVNMGPHKDIIGLFSASAKKYNIPFGVSSHDDRFLHWWLTAFGSDKSGPKKGVPYDGNMTKEDGKGKWWEGLDPADLYGLPPEKRTPEYLTKVKENWLLRHKELVTKYDVDMIWFDGYGFPYREYGKELCRMFLNNDYQENGKWDKIVVGKMGEEPIVAKDIERGGANEILYRPWQGITTFKTWFYKEDPEAKYKQNARTVIEKICDYSSKNGNLLLNVELLPDGTIPPKQKEYLDEIGNWLHTNGEAVYESKAWKIYGDNIGSTKSDKNSNLSETDLQAQKEIKKKEQFNERTIDTPPYGIDEVRFTTKGDVLYLFVLNPVKGEIEIPSLGKDSEFDVNKISSIELLGSDKMIKYKQTKDKLLLNVPPLNVKYAAVFKIEGAL
jgi:alpha-L-fucosidase